MQALKTARLLRQLLPACSEVGDKTLLGLISSQLECLHTKGSISLNLVTRGFSSSALMSAGRQQPMDTGDFGGRTAVRPDSLPLADEDDSEDEDIEFDDSFDNPLTAVIQKRSKAAGGPNAAEFQQFAKDFEFKVVDVNRTSRGSPTGGIGRFSAIVVCGNRDGVIGFGTGKSLQMGEAVTKANRQAFKTLFFVPRYLDFTIREPITSTYGKCKVIMYPRSSGSGLKASPLMQDLCQLAGIQDIGIKCHGSRNLRNSVKALIRGFESQRVQEEEVLFPRGENARTIIDKQSRRFRNVPVKQTIGLISIPR